MSGPLVRIHYDGGDADDHSIDMRLLGESLQGLDRIISDGVIVIATGRVPKRGERAPLTLKVREPQAGSYELTGYLQDLAGLLALGIPVIAQTGSDLILDWIKAVISKYCGKKDQMEAALEAMLEAQRLHLEARDRSDERDHEHMANLLSALRETIDKLGPAAAQAVAPVGPSVRSLGLGTDDNPLVEIDEPTAEILREHAEIEVGDAQTMYLRTDGFTFHTRKLSVEHPDRSGYISAEVRDPIFSEESNPYTVAAQKKATIKVTAKPGYRSGRLERLFILDFGGEVEDAA